MLLAKRWQESSLNVFSLVFAGGTLICCALPILLVSLGLGSTVAALVSAAPWLVPLSHNKGWLFTAAALLLAATGWLLYRPGRLCPADPVSAHRCAAADRWNRRVWWLALMLWGIGAFSAYLLLPLKLWFEG
jgi:hypothetical protein